MKILCANIFFCVLFVFIFSSCNNNANSHSGNELTTSISDAQSVDIKRPDPFYLKIKGESPQIKPGKAIGNLSIGEKTDSLQKLGRPQKGDAGMCKSLGRWLYGDTLSGKGHELDVFSECDPADSMRPHIKWIRTTDSVFKTQKGIGVNSTYQKIKLVYTDLNQVATYTSATDSVKIAIMEAQNKGITFEIATRDSKLYPQGKCRAIVVHNPKKSMPAMYFSFYKDLKLRD